MGGGKTTSIEWMTWTLNLSSVWRLELANWKKNRRVARPCHVQTTSGPVGEPAALTGRPHVGSEASRDRTCSTSQQAQCLLTSLLDSFVVILVGALSLSRSKGRKEKDSHCVVTFVIFCWVCKEQGSKMTRPGKPQHRVWRHWELEEEKAKRFSTCMLASCLLNKHDQLSRCSVWPGRSSNGRPCCRWPCGWQCSIVSCFSLCNSLSIFLLGVLLALVQSYFNLNLFLSFFVSFPFLVPERRVERVVFVNSSKKRIKCM